MSETTISNPRWGDAAQSVILLDMADGESPGTFEYVSRQTDPHGGAEFFRRASEGEFGPIGGYVEPPPPTLPERRDLLLPRLAQKRYAVETGGISAMGVPVRTDEVGQSKLTGALALFANDPTLITIDWEAQPGIWVTLDSSTIAGLGVLVGRHVQACFSRARTISEAIQAASTHAEMDVAEAEIEVGWPG